MPSTPASSAAADAARDAHQALLDQMDIYYVPKPFRNPNWKPSTRRNKNTKQIIGEAHRKEASVLATQNNSGASTPAAASGIGTDGAMTPAEGGVAGRPVDMGKASQSLSTLVMERNLAKAASSGFNGAGGGGATPGPYLGVPGGVGGGGGGGPAVTYTNIESAPSLHPSSQKHYCDITGLPSRYTDPKTKLRYYDREVFAVVRTLPPGGPDQYLAARGANVVLK